eukprot:jgi/Chlat1/8098/Chrsp75S07592
MANVLQACAALQTQAACARTQPQLLSGARIPAVCIATKDSASSSSSSVRFSSQWLAGSSSRLPSVSSTPSRIGQIHRRLRRRHVAAEAHPDGAFTYTHSLRTDDIDVANQQHSESANSTADQLSGDASSSSMSADSPEQLVDGNGAVAPAATDVAPSTGGMPRRWQIVAAMAAAFVLCNMDKVNMSVAVIPMAQEFGWNASQKGLVGSAFFWGYVVTQVPGGWVAAQLGGSKVLAAGVALWSIGTLLAPSAAYSRHHPLLGLCASRVLVGLGEGVAPSAATAIMASKVPSSERARAVSLVFGGMDLGSAVGLLIAPAVIATMGWPYVFWLFAVIGLFWCIGWVILKPDTVPSVSKQKKATATPVIATATAAVGVPPAPSKLTVPWGKFFASSPVWGVIAAHFCYNWGYYTLLAWLPSFFQGALKLDIAKSSLLSLIPYIAMVVMTPFVGPVADSLVARGWSVTHVRKLAQSVALLGPAACMLALAALTSSGTLAVWNCVTLLSVAFGLGAWSRLYCNHQDLSPKYASVLLGISNTAGALPGIIGVWLAGSLLDRTKSWSLALFVPTAVFQVLGTIVFVLLGSGEQQGWDD